MSEKEYVKVRKEWLDELMRRVEKLEAENREILKQAQEIMVQLAHASRSA